MKRPRVYVETTIPSFFHTSRKELVSRARRQWTREWWEFAQDRYELVTSAAVVSELRNGKYPTLSDALELIAALPVLDLTPEIPEIVEAYFAHRVMPGDPNGDALHLALASHHRCNFLVTWNCKHLANGNKFGHIRRINKLLGLHAPALVTPIELMGDPDGTTDETDDY